MAIAPKAHRAGSSTPREEYDKRRGTAQERGYDHSWHKVRTIKVKHDPLCQDCEDNGLTVQVDEVDHIIPINDRHDPLRLNMDNLRSRCKACHTTKTRHDTKIRALYDRLTARGMDRTEAIHKTARILRV